MGESGSERDVEVAALREAFRLGYRLIDSAEMYGDGEAEAIVGLALAQSIAVGEIQREQLFVVSKVYPHHASAAGVEAACERSLRRLGVNCLDLYLLHWRGQVPLRETVAGFERLIGRGLIRRWGVSNFDTADLVELFAVPGGHHCAVNQIYFSLGARGAAFSLLPWMRERGVVAMAYSPLDQGVLATSAALQPIADRLDLSPAQLALAWVLAQPGVVAIPKAVRTRHLRDNIMAADVCLPENVLREIDLIFPAPRRKTPLAML